MKSHVICTTDPSENFKYFLQNPLEYLQSSSEDGRFNEDDLTVISALQSIDEDDVMRHSEYLCDLYYQDEIDNLSGINAALPYAVIVANRYSGIIQSLTCCERVADIVRFCMREHGDEQWTLQDENGILRCRIDGDIVDTFLMIDGEGETHNIGPIVQKVYGYNY